MKSLFLKNKFLAFLLGWWLLSLLQAAVTGLNEDEAYYWMWSRALDWGYFDHPPMVALQIAIGQIFGNTKATLRLVTTLLNAGAIYFLWKIVSDYTRDPKFFWLAILSFPLVHIYAFVTTPDAALFFFSTAFFFFYKKYSEVDNWKNAGLVMLCIALMFYSKYHAVLVVGFTVLSNLKLLTRKSFWVIAFGSIALLFPHIFWQISHDYPSVRYHLFERSKSAYRVDFTTAYLLNQFLVLGPLTAFFTLKSAWKTASQNDFERALKWNFYGILIFFFVSSFKGWVEPHWTYLAVIPISILGIKGLAEQPKLQATFYKFALPSLGLLFIIRIMLAVPGPWANAPALKRYYHGEEYAKILSQKAAGKTLIYQNGFQSPSLYAFYSGGEPVFVQTDISYRKHQYDLWDTEENLFKKTVLRLGKEGDFAEAEKIETPWGTVFLKEEKNYFGIGKLAIRIENPQETYVANSVETLEISIENQFNVPIEITPENNRKITLVPAFRQYKNVTANLIESTEITNLQLAPGEKTMAKVQVRFPEKTGDYQFFIGARTENSEVRNNGRSFDIKILGN